MSRSLVELSDVFCVHRTDEGDAAALQGMNLDVFANEIVSVLGPSGAGKSTMLRLIAGLQLPSAGIVRVLGRDVGRLRGRARARLRHNRLGFLGQHPREALSSMVPARTAVALPLALRGASKRAREQRVNELLDAAEIRDRADAFPADLSGGERQRFALCAALAHRPALLLADEPTGELDDHAAAAIRALIAALAQQEGTTVIVVSHDPAMAEIADRTIRIRNGRVVEDRRGGESALVVGPGGWVQLPPELLTRAGIGRRASARAEPEQLILTPAADGPGSRPPRKVARSPHRWSPARVELHSVSRSFTQGADERRVLHEFAHAFAPGRMTAVTGRSGTGKTTLLKLVAGLDRPDAGELALDELRLDQLDGEERAALRRRRVGYLAQEPAAVSFLSAEENVVLVLRLRGWDPGAARARAVAVLARVGLAERTRQRVGRLSAGEVQRVALARALASARGLLIVDEPTSRLDESSALEVAQLLAEAAANDGQTVICASHDPALTRSADEVLALHDT